MTKLLELLRKPPVKVRRYVYRVASAGLAVAGVYGLVDGKQAAAWLLAIAAVTGMADANARDDA